MNSTWKSRYRETPGWAMDEFLAVAGRMLAELGLGPRDTPNERLVRYYAGEGAMTKPAREGREARYSYRHLVEFLLTRILIDDGWPLAKIAKLMESSSLAALENMLPDLPVARTPAQREVERLKRSASAKHDMLETGFQAQVSALSLADSPEQLDFDALGTASETMLERQSELSTSRHSVPAPSSLAGLRAYKPAWRRAVEIELTPWCRVTVDASKLDSLDGSACELVGRALTQALHARRLQRRQVK